VVAVAAAASLFSHGRHCTAKETIHGNRSKEEHKLVCISSSSVHAIEQIRLGFFQTGSCDPTHFGMRPKSMIQAVFLVRIMIHEIPSVIRMIQH